MSQSLFEDLLSCTLTGDPNSEDHYIVSKKSIQYPISIMEAGKGKKLLFEVDVVESLAETALQFQKDYEDVNEVLKSIREDFRAGGSHSYELLQECRTILTTITTLVTSFTEVNQKISPDKILNLIEILDNVAERLPLSE